MEVSYYTDKTYKFGYVLFCIHIEPLVKSWFRYYYFILDKSEGALSGLKDYIPTGEFS